MVRRLLFPIAVALALTPAGAGAQGPVGGIGTANIEHVALFPLDGRANGGKLIGKTLYVTTGKTLEILDVSTPESPRSLGSLDFELLDAGYLATGYQEDVDSNGKILIRSEGGEMQVVDVRDPTKPAVLSTLSGVDNHTMSCILDCTWVYGSEGAIVDLRDPLKPVNPGNSWLEATPGTSSEHDVTEVAPGLVLTATDPMFLLDARQDPANPQLLAEIKPPGFVHGTAWPGLATGDIALAGGEGMVSPVCQDGPDSTFHTWDTRGWRETKTFKMLDEYRLTPTEQEGGTASVWCTHWFDHHPQFLRGGLVTISWYEQGVRLLQVAGDGTIEQTGYFIAHGGSTWDVRWISDRIVYSFDHHRGIDILRYTGDIPDPGGQLPQPPPPGPPPPSTPPPGGGPGGSGSTQPPRFADLVRMPKRCGARRSLSLLVRARRDDPVTGLVVRVGRKVVRRASGAALGKPVRVRRLPRRAFVLRVEARTRSGAKAAGQRRYRGCPR